MDDVTKLMVEQLKDAYSAEKQGLRAMPRVAKKISSQALKDLMQMHREQTEHQVERLEQAAVEAKSESAARRAELEAALEEAQASAGSRSAARTQCTLL